MPTGKKRVLRFPGGAAVPAVVKPSIYNAAWPKCAISSKEALELLEKLRSQKVPVYAVFFSASGVRAHVRGFVDGISEDNGVVVSESSPRVRGTSFIAVPLSGRDFECSYGNKVDFPELEREEYAERFGASILSFRFLDADELFALTFTI